MRKLILAGMEISGRDCVVCVLQEEGEIWDLRVIPREKDSALQNIYVGQVETVSQNMEAAFVRISPEKRCFFPLKEEKNLIYACPTKESAPLKNGDLILVQVKKDPMKGKPATVTAKLSIAGRYLAVTTGGEGIGISKKLPEEQRAELRRTLFPILQKLLPEHFEMVLRTNAAEALPSEAEEEADDLISKLQWIRSQGIHRTLYSCLYKPESEEICFVRDSFRKGQTEIVTDLAELYDELLNMGLNDTVRFYNDPLLPLYRLYSLEGLLQKSSEEGVWLKSGAFLVIQETEACTVIDVNTGKNIRKMDAEEAALQVNLEAAKEAAIQMRLRNLSGIILIDFINMKEQAHRDLLTETLSDFLRMDPDGAVFVDMTALQIAEITRRKVRKPLSEVIENVRN